MYEIKWQFRVLSYSMIHFWNLIFVPRALRNYDAVNVQSWHAYNNYSGPNPYYAFILLFTCI